MSKAREVRLIVCGSRDWTDRALLERVLDGLFGILLLEGCWPVILQGEAPGADQMAREWAERRCLDVEGFPADWSRGRRAGPERNRRMLESGADGVIAFSTRWPATPGTASMCRLAYDAGLPVAFATDDGRVGCFQKGVSP